MNVDEHLASGIYNDFTQSGDVGVDVDGGDANVESEEDVLVPPAEALHANSSESRDSGDGFSVSDDPSSNSEGHDHRIIGGELIADHNVPILKRGPCSARL